MFYKLVLIAVAGGLGTLARYGLGGLVQNATGRLFPWGTAAVNLLGCLVFGVLAAVFEERWTVGGPTRMVVLVGFLGGFTTFSSFVFETGELLRDAQWAWASGNVLLQNVGGVICLFVGLALGKLL